MEWKAVVRFLGDPTHYNIELDRAGIYHARLLKYEGFPGKTPPQEVLLVKGVRRWNGSYEVQELIDELGRAIETRQRGDNTPLSRTEPTGT
jgi:hypothetical protein